MSLDGLRSQLAVHHFTANVQYEDFSHHLLSQVIN